MDDRYSPEHRKNFFWQAGSEAYQDAFLAWLFTNHDTAGELGAFSKYFIEALLNGAPGAEGLHLLRVPKIDRQMKKSDLVLTAETQEDGPYIIIIEDKVGSVLHPSKGYASQLDSYFHAFYSLKASAKLMQAAKCRLVFYKNQSISRRDAAIIGSSDRYVAGYYGSGVKAPVWQRLDIDAIRSIFDGFLAGSTHFENAILDSYYQHLVLWHEQYRRILKPDFALTAADIAGPFWNERSWLWDALFERLADTVCDAETRPRTVIGAYNGNYWELAVHGHSQQTALMFNSRDIRALFRGKKQKHGITLSVNLKHKKYGDLHLPWEKDSDPKKVYRDAARDRYYEAHHAHISGLTPDQYRIEPVRLSKKKDGHYKNKLAGLIFPIGQCDFASLQKILTAAVKEYTEAIDRDIRL